MTKLISKFLLIIIFTLSLLTVTQKTVFAQSVQSGALGTGSARGFSDIVLLDFINMLMPEDVLSQKKSDDSGLAKALQEFCDVRSGNTMNLETWYSGTCTRSEQKKSQSSDPFSIISHIMAGMYTSPPASTAQYVAYIGQNIQNKHIVTPAYAQSAGFGFTRLSPLLKFWSLLRNTAYAFFVLVFVMYGFMIMFRVNIAPRVAMSIQTAIPKLIMVLLLITFSYAIAGFLIDMSYVLGLLIVNILEKADVIHLDFLSLNDIPVVGGAIQKFAGSTDLGFSLISSKSIMTGEGLGVIALMLTFLKNFIFGMHLARIEGVILGIPASVIEAMQIAGGFTPLAPAAAAINGINLVVGVIIILGLFFSFLKTLFSMLGSYIRIILLIAFSPLILLQDAMPGRRNSAFGGWVRNLVANLSVFPTVLILVMLAVSLLSGESSFITSGGTDLWSPPVFGSNGKGIAALIALGLLFMTSKFADMIKAAFQIKDNMQYGRSLSDALNQGLGLTPYGMAKKGISHEVSQGFGNVASPYIQRVGLGRRNPPAPGTGGAAVGS